MIPRAEPRGTIVSESAAPTALVMTMPSFADPPYLIRQHATAARIGGRIVARLAHRLNELSEFSDEAIADLIDRHPVERALLFTMGRNPAHASQWRRGDCRGVEGPELVRTICDGRRRLKLNDLGHHHPHYRAIGHRLRDELAECCPSSGPVGQGDQITIAAAGTLEYLTIDTAPVTIWQLRGRQKIWVYPSRWPFLSRRTIDAIVTGERVDSIYYEPSFDDHAAIFELEAGEALVLPHAIPYRTVALGRRNVTLLTRSETEESRGFVARNRLGQTLGRVLPRGAEATIDSTLRTLDGWLGRWVSPSLRLPERSWESMRDESMPVTFKLHQPEDPSGVVAKNAAGDASPREASPDSSEPATSVPTPRPLPLADTAHWPTENATRWEH